MKVYNPRKTSSGCVHHTSARIVSPNYRRGMVISAFVILVIELPALNNDARFAFQQKRVG